MESIYKKDATTLEKLQNRATRLVSGLKNLSYKLKIISLTERRERGDLIEFFKINNGISKVVWQNPNKTCKGVTNVEPACGVRGHKYRIVEQVTKIKQRENFLTNREANNWRELPAEVINVKQKEKKLKKKNNRKKIILLKLKDY